MMQMFAKRVIAFAICCGALLSTVQAADLLPAETRLATAAGAPAPSQLAFTVATAQDLVVTLTDLQFPAAASSLSIVVSQADAIVASATVAPPATTATIALPAAAGNFTMYVFGIPGASSAVATFTACTAPKTNPSNCIQGASLSANITAQSSTNDPTVSTLSTPLTVATAGSYTFNFADLLFPAALNVAANLALFQGSLPVIPPGQTGPALVPGTALMLSPGTYTLLGIAQADQAIKAGLYGVTITGPAGTSPLFDAAIPVGTLTANVSFNNPGPQTVTLKVSDYAFPSALTDASALVTAGGVSVGTASAAGGAASFAAPAGTLNMWTYASAGAAPGTYGVDLAGTTDLYQTAQGVGSAGSNYAFAFVTTALSAGSYQATAADLQFPSQLTGLSFAVAQSGAILKQSPGAATVDFMAAAGPVVLLVNAQTPAAAAGSVSGNGLFDVNVQTTGAAAQLVYDKTQSVSGTAALFDSQTINLGASLSFTATLTDLKFPAAFDNLALVLSRGAQILGKIYGGGPFTFAGTPGAYQLTFVATPAATEQFGLYGVKIVPAAPAVTLTASAASVVAGASVQLNWTVTGATSCTASGGNFTGSKAASATSETVVVAATATFSLACTGDGGTSTQSVLVTATAKPSSSGGGGGSLDLGMLALLGVLVGARHRSESMKLSR